MELSNSKGTTPQRVTSSEILKAVFRFNFLEGGDIMNLQSYYRLMFFTGALWNWGAAILFFLAYKPIFAWLGMKELNYQLVMYAFLILVFYDRKRRLD